MKTSWLIPALLCITSLAAAQSPTTDWERERQMTREDRIKKHQAKIDDIIAANRVIQANSLNATSGGGPIHVPRVQLPESFENTTLMALKQVNVPEEKIAKLREINGQLWEQRVHKDNPTAPDVSAKVQSLLAAQDAVLTPAEREAFNKVYSEEMKKQQAKAEEARARSAAGKSAAPAASTSATLSQ